MPGRAESSWVEWSCAAKRTFNYQDASFSWSSCQRNLLCSAFSLSASSANWAVHTYFSLITPSQAKPNQGPFIANPPPQLAVPCLSLIICSDLNYIISVQFSFVISSALYLLKTFRAKLKRSLVWSSMLPQTHSLTLSGTHTQSQNITHAHTGNKATKQDVRYALFACFCSLATWNS